MKKALLVASVAVALAACTRAPQPLSTSAAPVRPQKENAPQPALEDRVLYLPSAERVLTDGDNSSDDMQWQSLGTSFPTLLGEVRYGLVLTDTPLTDRDGNPIGTLMPATSRVEVLEAGHWGILGPDFRRSYRVSLTAAGRTVRGWIDSSSVALVLAESGGVAVGVMPRKIVVGGGQSEYSLLVVWDGRHAMLVDTSMFPFPDSFHPSGVLRVSLRDMNGDSLPEVVLEAETIVSLHYLGSTPVHWKAWLRRRDNTLVPILLYNVSFGTDSGFSYTARDRAIDSNGDGRDDLVRVDTDYTVLSGTDEFRTTTVSFFPWNGVEFKKDTLQDLPKLGTVTADHATLLGGQDAASTVLAGLSKGDSLYVFDRSDRRRSPGDPLSWWYKAVTKGGIEGWISGSEMELSWIDPLKVNRAAFLGQG